MIETMINEERAVGSNSHLKNLPSDALNNVYGYLLGKEYENNENADIGDTITKSIPQIDRRASTVKNNVADKKLQCKSFKVLLVFSLRSNTHNILLLSNTHNTFRSSRSRFF